MKIKITSNPITPYGSFSVGQVISDKDYPIEFLKHLVEDCNAAEWMEYDTKVDDTVETKKKPQSTPSLPPAKVSPKKTRKPRTKKARSLPSTTPGS